MFLPFDGIHAVITPVIDISGIYASGDVLFAPLEIANAVQETKGSSFLRTVMAMDASNQKSAIDLLFFDSDPGSLGALNAALNISSAQLLKIIGMYSMAAADWITLKNNTNAAYCKGPADLLLPAIKGSKSIWMAGVSRGTPTYAAATDLTLKLALERH